MVQYSIENTAGAVIASVPLASVNTTATPLALVGQGVSLYGVYTAENFVKLLENFANVTPPDNPLPGTVWYDSTTTVKQLNYYDDTRWSPILSARTSMSYAFPRLGTADAISFSAAAATAIFTAPGTTENFYPTGIILIPNGSISASDSVAFNLYIDSSEDVMDNVLVSGYATNKHAFFPISGSTRFASGTDTIYLEVTTPASSGSVAFDAHLFGFVR